MVPDARGIYVYYFEIPEAGNYQVTFESGELGSMGPIGLVAVDNPLAISPGEQAPRSETRTSTEFDLSVISSDPDPDPSFYEMSIAAAVAVNCPANLRKHMEAGRSVGVRDEEIQLVVGLAKMIRGKAMEKIDAAAKALAREQLVPALRATGGEERLGLLLRLWWLQTPIPARAARSILPVDELAEHRRLAEPDRGHDDDGEQHVVQRASSEAGAERIAEDGVGDESRGRDGERDGRGVTRRSLES